MASFWGAPLARGMESACLDPRRERWGTASATERHRDQRVADALRETIARMSARRGNALCIAPRMHLRSFGSHARLALLMALVSIATPAYADETAERGPFVRLTLPMAPGLPELQRRAGENAWGAVCESPCRLKLDPRFEYRIGGRGVVDSDPFRLPPSGRVKVEAHVASSVSRDGGTAFEIGGFVFGAVGGALLLLPRDPHDPTPQTFVGWTFVGFGVLWLTFGVFLRHASHTDVTIEPLGADLRP
jgi:hypothetical protein